MKRPKGNLGSDAQVLNGKVIGSCVPRHRGKELIQFLHQLEQQVPPELDLHLILDNYSTHKSAEVQRWLKPKKRLRFHFHFTLPAAHGPIRWNGGSDSSLT